MNAAFAAGEAEFVSYFASPQSGSQWYAALSAGRATIEAVEDEPNTLRLTTRFVGDRRAGTETLGLRLSAQGTILGATDADLRPIWTIAPTTITTAEHGTVLSSGLSAAAASEWADRLDQASTRVRNSGVLAPANAWDGGLVVELPADAEGFSAVTGASATDTSAITSCGSGTARIVINPLAIARGADFVMATLVHEAVHVATDSPCQQGVAWVVEGMAESVAAAADHDTATSNAQLVRAFLDHHQLPAALPANLITQTDYALAQVAADQVRVHLAAKASGFFAQGVAGQLSVEESAKATKWYLAELRRRS